MLLLDYEKNAAFWRTGKKEKSSFISKYDDSPFKIRSGWSGNGFFGYPCDINELYSAGKIYERAWSVWGFEKPALRVHFPKPVRSIRCTAAINESSKLTPEPRKAKFQILDEKENILAESSMMPEGEQQQLCAVFPAGSPGCIVRAYEENCRDVTADFLDPVIEYCDGTIEYAGQKEPFPAELNISFLYDGTAFDPDSWEHEVERIRENSFFHRFISPDQKLLLEVEARIHDEFHVIELIPSLSCTGKEPTGIVEDFCCPDFSKQLIEVSFNGSDESDRDSSIRCNPAFKLHRLRGSKSTAEDFTPETVFMQNVHGADCCVLDTDEGRSSACYLPFYQLEFSNDRRIDFAVGWSGAWKSEIKFQDKEKFSVKTGLSKTKFRLFEGEKIRQPSCAVHFCTKDESFCRNEFRRFMIQKKLPRNSKNELFLPPVSFIISGTMHNQDILKLIQNIDENQLPFEVLWMDAGWYGPDREVPEELHLSDWYRTVGDWHINQIPHPGGLKPVSCALHKTGRRFLLWLEASRAWIDTPIASEHPEYFTGNSPNRMLDLGKEEACSYITELVSKLIEEEGVDCYREDFNFNTLPEWQNADTPERIGITESKFITGFYRFWQTLRERFPDLLIDNCASGGRRIDLETMSLSLPLWRSDFPCFNNTRYIPEVNQLHFDALAHYVPFNCCGTKAVNDDPYKIFSGAFSSLLFDGCNSSFSPDCDLKWLKKYLENCIRLRSLSTGYYDRLTSNPEDLRNFFAFELFDPEKKSGALVIFRRKAVKEDFPDIKLLHLDPEKFYQIEDESGQTSTVKGKNLISCRWNMPEPKSVKIVFFTEKESGL